MTTISHPRSITAVDSYWWGPVEIQVWHHAGLAFGWGYGFGRTFFGLGIDFGRLGLRAKMRQA